MTVAQRLSGSDGRFVDALGEAVVRAWGFLPQDIQKTIFEEAVLAGYRGERDEALREQLAEFLHDHHPRTAKMTT
ncbi:MAG: hypothetical protein AB7K64_19015 [Variibacter sp.]